MSNYVKEPILIVFGLVVAMVVLIAAVILLSTTGIGGAGTSTALVSTSTSFQGILAFLGIIIAGGVTIGAMSRRS